jgi:hypothetical protein
MKGVEATTGRLLSEIMMDYGINKNNIAILAGPGQPESIVENKKINKMVVSAYDFNLAKEIQGIIKTDNFRLYPWPDVKGCELCGASKNPYSIIGGMCEGADQKTLKGQIMSVSMREMQNYLKAMQCNPETVIHLALLADYNATLYDPVSHNLNYGIEVIKQRTIDPDVDFIPEGKQAVNGLIKRILGPVLTVIGVAAVLYAIYLGVMYAKAESADKRKEVQGRLIGACIGAVIIIVGATLCFSLDWANIFGDFSGLTYDATKGTYA